MKKDADVATGTINISDDNTVYYAVYYIFLIKNFEKNVLWKLGELKKDVSNKLTLVFEKKEGYYIDNKSFTACLKFQVTGFSISGTKIEKADVKNSAKNLVKKARNISKSGYFEIRLN